MTAEAVPRMPTCLRHLSREELIVEIGYRKRGLVGASKVTMAGGNPDIAKEHAAEVQAGRKPAALKVFIEAKLDALLADAGGDEDG